MTNNCNVARDLMPLVIDGVASEESQQYVDEHIAECTECALTYGAMKVELPRANQEKERAEMEKAAKEMRKKRRKRIAKSVVLGVVLCFVLVVGGLRLWEELTLYSRYPMAKSEVAVQLYKMSDGTGLIVYDLEKNNHVVSLGWGYEYDNGVITLRPEKPAIYVGHERYEKMYGGYRTDKIGGWEEQGWMKMTAAQVEAWNTSSRLNIQKYDPNPIQEIWVEYSDGRELIYQHGDEVSPCSAEMEAYLEYLHNPPDIGKGKYGMEYDYDKLAELRSAVPEWNGGKLFAEKYVCENGDLKLEALYYDVSQQPGELRVQVDVYSFPSGNPFFELQEEYIAVNDDTGICVQYHAVYTADADKKVAAGYNAFTGRIEDGVWVQLADDLRDEDGKRVSLPVVRIELHAGDDFVVLWEEGDVLQEASEAASKRLAEKKKYAIR